MYTDISNKNI